MTAQELLKELEPLGKASYKRLMMTNYGVKEPLFGVAIGELKKFEKRHKKDHRLALELYKTGNYDAMYLAGLIADDAQMTRKDLDAWAEKGVAGALPGSTVPWVAAGSAHGWEAGLDWIDSAKAHVAVAGWFTLGCVVALKPDEDLDLTGLKKLMARVRKELSKAPDMVRYAMNSFLISVGCYVKPLAEEAIETAKAIGTVHADLGNNSCAIPDAAGYIAKVEKRGAIGKKRKTVKC